jgi:hypothetical protein
MRGCEMGRRRARSMRAGSGRRSLAEGGSNPRCLRSSARLKPADTRSAWSRLQTYELMREAFTPQTDSTGSRLLRGAAPIRRTRPGRRSSRSRSGDSADATIATGLAALLAFPGETIAASVPQATTATVAAAVWKPLIAVRLRRGSTSVSVAGRAGRAERSTSATASMRRAKARQGTQRPRWAASSRPSSSDSSPSARRDAHVRARSHR